jgi:hypothetical protein
MEFVLRLGLRPRSGRSVLLALVIASSSPAFAAPLQQPNGAAIPSQMGCDSGQPTGLAAELACECTTGAACNIGPACPHPGPCVIPTGTCETTLYHSVNDNTCIPSNLDGLDPWQDGQLTPETYTPTCALTFEVVSRGTARFKNIFGWYNVTGQRPADTDLVPMIDCDTAPGTEVVLDVRNDPRWAGGEIGFFLATPEAHGSSGQCAGGDCCARVDRLATAGHVFYSQRALNPDAVGAQSIIHLVVYDSQIVERKFYFAWEDTLGAANNDFTDLVTSVVGVECAGGGTACDTGMPGMCQYGVTRCRGSSIECGQVFGATGESCDGADNDCDGATDEGLGCENLVGECATVTCPSGLICKQGQCIDACVNVACGSGETCLSGACVPGCNQCNGAVCGAGATCDSQSGDCVGGAGDGDAGPGNGGDGDAGPGGDDDDGVAPGAGCCSSTRAGTGDARAAWLLSVALLVAIGRRRSTRPRRA